MPPLPTNDEETTPIAHEALIGPACERCGSATRLSGIEPHPRQDHTDLRTYDCKDCGQTVTVVVPYASKQA